MENEMKKKRVMIAAPKSGSGKTMVTCALLWALKEKGIAVSSFKCGPDYIDPMFHEKVIHVPARNLDTFFTGQEKTRELFINGAEKADVAVLEGVMGLYDGLGGIREEGSSYHLARVTKTPIVLVVDAKGMGRSILSLLAGFLSYDRDHLIRGVILNKISKGYYEIIKPLIEEELKLQVAGFLPEKKECRIESRHLGLLLPNELSDLERRLQAAAEEFLQTVSLETIFGIAEGAGALERAERRAVKEPGPKRAVIGVARDEAFCFYYEDNIRLLEENGAEIVFFSPLREERLPESCHALLLGGGYPELYARALSRNEGMRRAVKQAADSGMPLVAECGGFMYLHTAIIDKEGERFEMADVIPALCSYTGKLVRFGYIELWEKQSRFLPAGDSIRGHEFHYYDSTDNGTDMTAKKTATKREYSCMIEDENRCVGFPHLYYPSNPLFARSFVEKAEKYKEKQSTKEGRERRI